MRKPSWSFTVRDSSEIDIQRILNETPEDEQWVVITDKHGNPVALFIRKEFLRRFRYGDDIVVCGESLHELWGSDNVPVFEQSSGRIYAPCCHRDRYEGLKGWSAAPVNHIGKDGKQVKISSRDIDVLKGAQRFIRRIPVRVYVASDC